jgi:hypothetical protein
VEKVGDTRLHADRNINLVQEHPPNLACGLFGILQLVLPKSQHFPS